ncbi:MAG: 39S ribosomal protein L45 [Burkholderiaceae bacterium]|nr:39S ribosomal protein L45 [Burkholderiaceae bacterium]
MKRFTQMLAVVMAAGAFFVADAEAKRLGGGGSFGRQSGNVTQRQATPPAGQGSQAQSATPRQAPAAAGQPARSKWLAPLAGLAAGLGLAALASYLGFGEELATLMLVLLLAFAAIVVVRMIMARRAGPRPALQGAYSAAGVGSEASVRYAPIPERSAAAHGGRVAPVGSAEAASGDAQASNWRVPSDFDVDGFVRNAKVQFVRLQAAFDASDLNDLREFTSPEMFAELKMQITERGASENRTDVVRLDAELLGIESGATDYLASVRFHGLIRESESAPAHAFDEVWNLSKPALGNGGWVLAGIQQLN